MAIALNMNNYKIENDDLLEVRYGDEVLFSGWNPVIEQVSQQCINSEIDKSPSMPLSLALVDSEVFMQKMYAYQR